MAGLIRRRLPAVLAILLAGAAGPLFAQEAAGVPSKGSAPEGLEGEPATGEPAASDAPASAGTAYLLLDREILDAERVLAEKILGEGRVDAADVEALAELAQKARASLYGELIDRSALLLILAEERLAGQSLAGSAAVRAEQIMKSRELEARSAKANSRRSTALWATLGTSAVSFALAFTCWYLSEWQDEQYFLAASVEDAVKHRTYFRLFSWISYVSAGVGVVSAGVSIPVLAGRQTVP